MTNHKALYEDYLKKVQDALEKDDFAALDYILEYLYTAWLKEEDLLEMDDILQEVTLYVELKETDYREEALRLLSLFVAE